MQPRWKTLLPANGLLRADGRHAVVVALPLAGFSKVSQIVTRIAGTSHTSHSGCDTDGLRLRPVLYLFIAACGWVLLAANSGLAQPAHAGPGGHRGPGGLAPSRPFPGSVPGGGMVPGPRGPRPKLTPLPAGEVEYEPIDPVTLPPGYQPPKSRPELMQLDKEIATAEEIKELAKNTGKYKTALNRGEYRDDEVKELIRKGIRYQLAQMTLASKRRELSTLRDELMVRQLEVAGKLADKADSYREFRRFVMTEAVKQISELLDNNYFVRLQAVLMLGQLNLTEDNQKLSVKEEPFAPAADPLIKVIESADQPEAVKIIAVQGLIRIFGKGQTTVAQKQALIAAVVPVLQSGQGHTWYQMRLTHLLAYINVEIDPNRKPVLVETLTQIMLDPTRDLVVRAEAARSLGRVPLAAAVNMDNLAKPIALVTLDLAKESVLNPSDKRWKLVALYLYLAFEPESKGEPNAAGKPEETGLNKHPGTSAAAKRVFEKVIPILAPLVRGDKVTQDQIQSLETWVKENVQPGTVADKN